MQRFACCMSERAVRVALGSLGTLLSLFTRIRIAEFKLRDCLGRCRIACVHLLACFTILYVKCSGLNAYCCKSLSVANRSSVTKCFVWK